MLLSSTTEWLGESPETTASRICRRSEDMIGQHRGVLSFPIDEIRLSRCVVNVFVVGRFGGVVLLKICYKPLGEYVRRA